MKSFAAISALAVLATAMPHAKRDVVWVTDTAVVTEVVDVTKTVWVNGADATESSTEQAPETYQTTVATTVEPSPTPYSSPSSAPSITIPTQPAIASTPSAYVAPSPATTPQTTAAPAPAPATQSSAAPSPAPVSSSAPAAYSAPAPSYGGGSGSGSSSGGNGCSSTSGTCNNGKFTYYTPGLGSCGESNTDSDYIFAYGSAEMQAAGGANPNANPLCGRKISIKAYDGTMITARLTDTCAACSGKDGMLDLSTGLWNRVAKGMPGADGVLSNMEYTWM